jgi:hypothetical protein
MQERGRPVAVHLVNIVRGGNGKFIQQANDDKIKKAHMNYISYILKGMGVLKMVKNLEDAYTLSGSEDNVRLYSKWAATYDTDFAQNSDYILPYQVQKQYML